jgi:hypothetical protein
MDHDRDGVVADAAVYLDHVCARFVRVLDGVHERL